MTVPTLPGSLTSWNQKRPTLLIVLVRYVFGGAVATGQSNYANFLIPGIFAMNAARCLVALAAMVAVGYAVGFRPSAGFGRWLAAIGLLVLVSYSFSWLLGGLGLAAGSVEGAHQMGALVWPLTFVSSAFVPAQSMPGWLRGFAGNQPVTEAIDATRALLLGQPVGNHVMVTVIWCAGITLAGMALVGILFRRKFN